MNSAAVLPNYAHVVNQWTDAEVLAASEAVDEAWLPADIDAVRTDDYLVLRRPAHMTAPGSPRVRAWVTSPRPFCQVRPEVEGHARAWGADEVLWRANNTFAPAVDRSLRSAGAALALAELVMARSLDGTNAEAWMGGGDPVGISTDVVTDEGDFDALVNVETAGWDWPPPPANVLAQDWATLTAELNSSSAFALLGYAEGTPASVARCAIFDSVVRLFGAVTLPAFRGLGLYRSLLAARCRLGRAHGATLALTKARPETSAPILERAGFRTCAVERSWRLPIFY